MHPTTPGQEPDPPDDDTPETPLDEPPPEPIQDPPAEPGPRPYVVHDGAGRDGDDAPRAGTSGRQGGEE